MTPPRYRADAQYRIAITVLVLLVPISGYLGLQAGRSQAHGRGDGIDNSVSKDNVSTPGNRDARVRLLLSVVAEPRGIDVHDLTQREGTSVGRGIGTPPEELLGTRSFPSPPYPTRRQYQALKREAVALSSALGLQCDVQTHGAGPARTMPVISVSRDAFEVGSVAFLRVRVQLRGSPQAELPSTGEARSGSELVFEYLGARKNADNWAWTHKAVLFSLRRFLQIDGVRARLRLSSGGASQVRAN